MAHKTYNLTPLQICSILMSLSALSCYKTGSVGTSKWPALLFSAAPRGVQTKERAAVVWQGLSARVPPDRPGVPAGSLPGSPAPPVTHGDTCLSLGLLQPT